MNRQSVINLAVKVFENHQDSGDTTYSVEDALYFSLEDHGVNSMEISQFDKLVKSVNDKEVIKWLKSGQNNV